MSHAIIISVYTENRNTISLCSKLVELGADNIIIVNDGCQKSSEEYFNELVSLGCHLVKIAHNKGKGASIRAGIKYAHDKLFNITGYILADADGQHKAEDIMKISRALELRPDNLIIEKRNFRKSHAPIKSRIGNAISSLYFRIITGVNCKDTQTGLRGVPSSLYELAVNTSGDKYDYEMNFLTKCADSKIPFYSVNIVVDYSNKEVSNYRMVKDTYLIYRTPLRFATVSIGCTAVDLAFFTFFTYLLPAALHWNVALATVMARIISGGIDFLINRRVIFKNDGKVRRQAVRFIILLFCIMCTSSISVSLLSFLPVPVTLMKVIVDLLLWSVNYIVQRKWVFKESK